LFFGIYRGYRSEIMDDNEQPDHPSPQETADQVAVSYFGVDSDPQSRQHAIRRLLVGAALVTLAIPGLFYLNFGEVSPLAWGLTIFLVLFCLLAAIGLAFRPLTSFHTPVPLRGGWADRLGAFWLVSCAFGPLLGWVITTVFPLMVDNWRWLYSLRILFAAGLPLITAFMLSRYVRGRGSLLMLLLVFGITLLPILTVVNVGWDLWEGVSIRLAQSGEILSEVYLKHTGRVLIAP
jgi:MFS family permease